MAEWFDLFETYQERLKSLDSQIIETVYIGWQNPNTSEDLVLEWIVLSRMKEYAKEHGYDKKYTFVLDTWDYFKKKTLKIYPQMPTEYIGGSRTDIWFISEESPRDTFTASGEPDILQFMI